ncbi:MAG: lysophospholipid acyltransferase family protein [bacterium]
MTNRIVRFVQLLIQIWFRMGLRLHVKYKENIPRSGPVIIASNHVSGFDPFLVGSLLPRVSYYLAKKELFENIFLRLLLQFLRAIPVDRSGQSVGGVREIKKVLEKEQLILLFPEGTRSLDGKIGEPKKGIGLLACTTNATIVPVFIDGMFKRKPSVLKRPKVVVTFGEPLYPQKLLATAKNRKEQYSAISDKVFAQLNRLSQSAEGIEQRA